MSDYEIDRNGHGNDFEADLEKQVQVGTTSIDESANSDSSFNYDEHNPDDPLNWSSLKKHAILFSISFAALLPDYGSAVGAVTLIPQAQEWNMTENELNHSQVGNVFMLGCGGLFATVCGAYFGRLPTVFWFLLFALWTAAWCAGSTDFNQFMAARILNGFFSTVTQGGGMMFIEDMFFPRDHARKINIWSAFIVISPYMGPLLTAFILTTQKWQWGFGLLTAMTGLAVILTVLLVEETFYNRRIPPKDMPPKGNRALRIIGVEQWKTRYTRNTFSEAVMRPIQVILKPTVLISCVYYVITFAWVVGINTTLAVFLTEVYGFKIKQVGFFYFTPIVAVILGETCGHWLHDLIANHYMRRHDGHLEPEARLRANILATPFMIAGLILMGFALENKFHYMLVGFGWGLYVFGVMIMTVGINAYNLSCYPQASGEVTAWINMARTTGGFIVSYFMITWVGQQGAARAFGEMAAIVFAGLLMILCLYFFGKRLRTWAGPLHVATY